MKVLEDGEDVENIAVSFMTVDSSLYELDSQVESDMVVVEINNQSLAYEKSMWLDFMMPRWLTNTIYVTLITLPPALSHYKHVRHFALTLVAVIVVDIAFLQYAYISFFCLLAGLATLHLVYIILTNKCARECPELFA